MGSSASVPDRSAHPDREQLAAWQAGALAEPAGAKVEAHLAGCAECAAAVSAVEGARTALASLREPELPPGLHERLAAAIDREATVVAPERAAIRTRGRAVRRRRTRAWNRRAAAIGTAAALVLLVAGLVPVLRQVGAGSGSQQTSGPATASPTEAAPGGARAVPEFQAPDGYSASALRTAIAGDQAVHDAYARAGASGAPATGPPAGSRSAPPGTATPDAAQGATQLEGSGSSKDTAIVDQQACLDRARAVRSEDLRPAFFVETVYQGRLATVLVTRRAGTPGQAQLWAFPRGDCSKAPFANERVQVPPP